MENIENKFFNRSDFYKAQRIRSIESKGIQKIDEGVINEFIGIVNYSVIGLIQIDLGVSEQPEDLEFKRSEYV